MPQGEPGRANKLTLESLRHRYSKYKLFRVFPEWCSSGVWMPAQIGNIPVGPNLILDDFPISTELKARLAAWQEKYDAQNPPHDWMSDIDRCGFQAEGLNIALQL